MDRIEISREALLDGSLREWVERHAHLLRPMSDEERRASVGDTLARAPDRDRVWLFAYGSLMWNPAFRHVERRRGIVHGYHRRFCLWTPLGRGSPDVPGLTLGLEPGGSCRGVAYRVAPHDVDTELDIVWRREMLTSAYRPVWVRVRTEQGVEPAVTFAVNDAHERYTGRLAEETVIEAIAAARGALGSCCDYLFETVEHLADLGIHDRRLEGLARAVRGRRERAADATGARGR